MDSPNVFHRPEPSGYMRVFGSLNQPAADQVVQRDVVLEQMSMAAALRRCVQRGLDVKTIIDVGASDGRWSVMARSIIPGVEQAILIEAQDVWQPALEELHRRDGSYQYVIAAASSRNGTELFAYNPQDPMGGTVEGAVTWEHPQKKVTAFRVDDIVLQAKCNSPFLLKLDTHGWERNILQGAESTLMHTSLAVIEVYNFDIQPCALPFWKMATKLQDWPDTPFRCIDIADPMWRPGDHAFWQMDMLFIPSSTPLFKKNTFR